MLVSLVTLAVTQISIRALVSGAALGTVLTALLLLMGIVLGAVSVGLSYITSGKERTVLVVLVGLVLAALTVILGGYGNRSLLPVGIYGLALLSSLLIARVTALLGNPAESENGRNLRV
jgi:hypothetical protein